MGSTNGHWISKPLKEVGKVVTGTTPSKKHDEYYGGDIPFVTPGELGFIEPVVEAATYLSNVGAEKAKLIPKNSVMVCCIGSLGKIGFAGRELTTNQQINSIIFDETQVDPRYGFRFCETLKPLLEHIAPSTTVAIVNKSRFESLEIPLPPLAEQRRIAAILDLADALRAKRRAALAKLDTLLQATFLDMFGDPVTNPRGWEELKLYETAEKFSDGPFGSNLKTAHYTQSGVQVIRLQNIGIGYLDESDKAFISEEHFQSLPRHHCYPGDIIVGTMGEPNLRACIVPKHIKRCLNKADCVQYRVNPSIINRDYACWLLNNPRVIKKASKLSLGQTRLRISMGRLKELIVPVPPIEEQMIFSSFVRKHENQKQIYKAQDKELDNLFHSFQQRAFKGEL